MELIMDMSNWQSGSEYEAGLALKQAQARQLNASAATQEQELSSQQDFAQLAQGMPQATSIDQAEQQLYQLTNMAVSKGKPKLAGELLGKAGQLSHVISQKQTEAVEVRAKQLEMEGQMIQRNASDAQAIVSYADAGATPEEREARGEWAWNNYKAKKAFEEGDDVSELPLTFKQARGNLELMSREGIKAAEQRTLEATRLRDAETARMNKIRETRMASQNAVDEVTKRLKTARIAALKKAGVKDDELKDVLKLQTARKRFLDEWPPLPAETKKLPKGTKASNLAGYQAVWDGDSWEVVGQPPDWWGKSKTLIPVIPDVPDAALDEED